MKLKNLINFDEQQQVFHLHNGNISYILGIDEGGVLSHLYFGPRIKNYHGQLKNPRKDRGFSDNLPGAQERTFSLDFVLQEYSSQGDGDFRNPAAIIRQANGSYSARFVYKDYKISFGKPQLDGLPAAYVIKENEAQTLKIILEDQVNQLELILIYTIYQDYDVIARSVELINKSDKSVHIEKIASMQLDLPAGKKRQVISLPGAHANERQLQREDINAGTKVFESRRGTTSHQMNNFIAICDSQTDEFQGNIIGLSFVYSGNHKEEIEKDQYGATRILVGINNEQFDWEVKSQQTFQTPEVLMTYSAQGMNKMSDNLHRLMRERVARGKYKFAPRPILVNNWEATFMDFDENKLKPIVDEAKKLGIEMFVLDDGWFGHRDDDNTSLGDWKVFARKFPQGLKRFVDYIHANGLKFGLWFEPEMISIDSELYQQHPDYMLKVPGSKPSPSRNQYVLDMGRQEVRDNIYNQMTAILDSCQIDYVKWDMNRHLTDIYSPVLPANCQGEVLHRYVLGLYQMLEKITTEYPDILWEGCSGGGGRFDAGFLYYMPQSWTSDNTDAVARIKIQYGTSIAYPISSMTAHVSASPNQQTGRLTSMKTRGEVAMSGVLGYELDLTKLSSVDKKEVQAQIAFYKKIRSLVQYGKFIRLISPYDNNRCAWMFVSDDKNEAIVFSFKIMSEAQPAFEILKLSGLDADKTYKNLDTGAVIGGDELMNTGFYEPITQADFSSQVYHFKALAG